ncbi:amino acid adenylation domain-containing protein [Nocardia amamiensis]|uniref:amino acid adenylation domain-containing protein n=1 Tax=Nocardia amamiensis TaxID=404578 RepID=UPI00082B21E6|nr:non-ribosomal peptide synthetase [Nocardia amamiensis]
MTSEPSATPHRPEAWPVSAYQRDVLSVAFRYGPAPVTRNAYCAFMDEPFDMARLQAVIRRAVLGDAALRLRFEFSEGRFWQWISDDVPEVELIDLSWASDPAAARQEWVRRANLTPSPPRRPFRVAALVDRPDHYYLYVAMHHAMLDGWGVNALWAVLVDNCSRSDLSLEQLAEPEPVTEETDRGVRTYRKIAAEHEEYLSSPQWVADRDALVRRFEGVVPALFSGRASTPNVDRGRRRVVVEPAFLDRIRATGFSVFAFTVSALAAYLTTVHRSEEVVIGVPMLNRHSAETFRTAGHRTNVVPLRIRVDPAQPLSAVASEVAAQIRELKRYERFPYGDLARALSSDPTAPPLFDVAYSYIKMPSSDHLDKILGTIDIVNPGTVLEALNILAVEHARDGSLNLQLYYDRDVFDENFPFESAVRSIGALLMAALDRPDAPVSALPLMPARELAAITAFETGPREEFPYTTIDRLFRAAAAEHPDRVAIEAVAGSGERALRYRELSALADGFAARLRALGVTGNECVPVVLTRSTELLVAIFGTLRAGCAYVPLDPDFPATRIETVLADCGARFVVAGPEHQAVFDKLRVTRITVAGTEPARGVENVSHPADLSYLIYTSGSTGVPKGVMIEHRSVVNRLTWMQRRYPLHAEDVILQKTPVTFDVSVWELFWWAITGARLALLEPGGERDPRRIVDAIAAHTVTVLHFVPSMLAAFVDELAAGPAAVARIGSLRRVFCSGEALPPALVRRFHAVFTAAGAAAPELVNLYGPTEATVDVSYFDCPRDEAPGVVPIGRPIDNIDLLVLDETGRRVPVGVPGELNIAGVGVARGYRGRPELTAAVFVDDRAVPGRRRYRTGDLARWLPDGNLEYLGRFDDQVKIRGNRVTLGEVHNAMLGCRGVRAAAVVDELSEAHGVQLVGYFVGTDVTGEEIAEQIAAKLPRYMVPTRLIRVDRIPLTRNGKLDRRALAEQLVLGHGAEQVAGVEPRTDVEARLARVWCTVLGVESIGVHDNFFTHGGDSILALTVRTAAERAGLYFDVDAFYQAPTIAELARVVRDDRDGDDHARVVAPLATVPLIDRAALHQVQDAFPATALQLGMLYHSIERADSVTYKDAFRYRLEIPWDDGEFRAAVDRLVRRQPALRSSFELSRYSIPLQIVHTEVPYELEIVDLGDTDELDGAELIESYLQERTHAEYDMAVAALFAIRVFVRPGPQEPVGTVDLVLSFHHAILDGWSVATSVLELLLDYLSHLGMTQTRIEATPHPATVLAEYAQVEQSSAHDTAAREYWLTALAGAEPTALTALSAHQPAVAEMPQAKALMPRRLARRVTAFATRHQIPEKSVYLAAHCLALRELTGHTDVTTGVVTHGRPDRAGAERVAGLFLNTLPVRLDGTATTWRAAVEQVARREREAYPYRRYPLRSILADGGPVFETAFNYVNYHVFQPMLVLDGVRLLEFDAREETNFQLLVTAATDPRDGRMWLRVNGDHTLTTEQCETVALTQLRMLAGIVADPDAAIDRGAGPAMARDVGTLVADAAALNAAAIAVAGDDESVTYDELIERADRLARRLAGLGVSPGDRVGILMRRRPELIPLVLALTRIGAACVPLDVSYPRARLNLMIDRAHPHRVVADADYRDIVDDPALVLDTAQLFDDSADDADVALPEHISPDSVAYVLFTSGSTGEPKGVAMPHRGLTALVDWQIRAATGTGLRSTLQLAPLSFDVSFQEIFTTLAAGSTLRVSSADLRSNVEQLLTTVVDEGIERLFLPYVALQAFAEAAVALRKFPTELKVLISSGEQLRITDEIRALCKVVPGLVLENQYGPTESHVATTFTLQGPADEFPALPPIGRAVDGDTVELLDSALRPVPDGVIGEIYLGGRSLARGYAGRPALTAQRFVATHAGGIRYRTGDLGVQLFSGDIVCLGRSDNQVKIRGFRVEPAEVELCILGLVEKFPGITEAAVVARGFGGIDGSLIAFLVGAAEQTDLAALRHDLRAVLPAHMVPSRFAWLDELPRTPSGKRDDAALREYGEVITDSVAAQREPADEYERSAVQLLAEYAGLRAIGVDDDFFAAGGTSIGAMRVVTALSRRWGADVPLDAFISAPTAAGLATLVRAGGDVQRTFDPLVPLNPDGTKPPLFLVHPIGGNVLCYLTLVRYLDPDRPVYGLQAAGADAGSAPEKTIAAMTESYLKAVRRVHPTGPYHLAGWSFGGYVALEMARQLPAHEVSSVTLLDTMALRAQARTPIPEEKLIRWFFLELLWYARGSRSALVDFEPDVHGSEELFAAMLAEAVRSEILPPASSPQAIRRLYEVFYANYSAMLDYDLQPYERDITLLRATEGLPPGVDLAHQTVGSMFDSADNGWKQYAARRFTTISVPGDHLNMMTEPNISELGLRLDEVLSAADPDLARDRDESMLDA